MTSDSQPAAANDDPELRVEGAPTFRDLCRVPLPEGRIAPRRIYRSGAFTALTPAGENMRDALGIRLVCDVRSAMERRLFPVTWPEPAPKVITIADIGVSAEQDRQQTQGYTVKTGEEARQILKEQYADFPRVFAGVLRELFVSIADDGELPVLINCTAGKDRTGFVTAILLLALGASEEAVAADYMETARTFGEREIRRNFMAYSRDFVPPDDVIQAYLVDPGYLMQSLAGLKSEYGSLDGYLRALGLEDARRSRLQKALVVGSD